MKSVDELCSAVVRVARESCINLIAEATNVHNKFSKVLLLFGKCHSGVNSGIIDEASINELGKLQLLSLPPPQQTMFMFFLFAETNIGTFMACYREFFAAATVLPKMHILEHHVVPWMRRWGIGAGLMGEQGAESIIIIHAHLNRLEAQFSGTVNPLEID